MIQWVSWCLSFAGTTMAQLGVSLSLTVCELRAFLFVSSQYVNLIWMLPCDDTLHNLEASMRAKQILCTDNSWIHGEDLASKINLISIIHICLNKQCRQSSGCSRSTSSLIRICSIFPSSKYCSKKRYGKKMVMRFLKYSPLGGTYFSWTISGWPPSSTMIFSSVGIRTLGL